MAYLLISTIVCLAGLAIITWLHNQHWLDKDAIAAIQASAANPNADPTLLDEARQLHHRAQFMWDFVSANNSMGFHNSEYALSILAEATDLARQAQMKAAQAANDPTLLTTGYYYTITPPTPEP